VGLAPSFQAVPHPEKKTALKNCDTVSIKTGVIDRKLCCRRETLFYTLKRAFRQPLGYIGLDRWALLK
jgi:hypothetical protein